MERAGPHKKKLSLPPYLHNIIFRMKRIQRTPLSVISKSINLDC